MIAAIAGLISDSIGAFASHAKQKSEQKTLELTGKYRIKQAQIESQIKRLESGDAAAISLDQLSFEHRGWKDEYLLIFTTAPVFLLFLAPLLELFLLDAPYQSGGLTQAVMAGFEAMAKTPDWYLGALLLVFVDTLGFRRLLRTALENKLLKK